MSPINKKFHNPLYSSLGPFGLWGPLGPFTVSLALLFFSIIPLAPAAVPTPTPGPQDIGIDAKPGATIPLDLPFTDEAGRTVRLSQYFGQGRPVALMLVYYECPMLCTLALNGLNAALKQFEWEPGRQFEFVAVSINPGETSALAAAKKEIYLQDYGRTGVAGGMHYLVGPEKSIQALTKALGFRYFYDTKDKQYAHATGLFIFSDKGKLAQVLKGIDFPTKELRLAMVEASEGKVGNILDRMTLFCYHYDPQTGRYTLFATRIMQLGGMLTVLLLGGIISIFLIREQRRQNAATTAQPPPPEPVTLSANPQDQQGK